MRTRFGLSFLVVVAMVPAAAFGAPESAKECDSCHGAGGVSTKADAPTIAGMSEFYIESQMEAYQKGGRACVKAAGAKEDMCEAAKKLNAAQVKEVATFYAGQKFAAATQTTDAALAAKGKAIHDANCELCHSEGGSAAADDAGILLGQWKPYLLATFKEFKDGKRSEPEKMKAKTAKLSDDDVKALAEHYASGKK